MLLLLQVLQLVLRFLSREVECRSPMGHVTVHPILEAPVKQYLESVGLTRVKVPRLFQFLLSIN